MLSLASPVLAVRGKPVRRDERPPDPRLYPARPSALGSTKGAQKHQSEPRSSCTSAHGGWGALVLLWNPLTQAAGGFLWVLSCRDEKVPRLQVREPD